MPLFCDADFSLTPCQQQLQELMSLPSNSSQFVPRCNQDGEYEPIQCNYVTGYCWCVDDDGREIESTKTKGKIQCGQKGSTVMAYIDDLAAILAGGKYNNQDFLYIISVH